MSRRTTAFAAAITLMALVKILLLGTHGTTKVESLSCLTDTSNIDYASIEGRRAQDASNLNYNSKNTFRKDFNI